MPHIRNRLNPGEATKPDYSENINDLILWTSGNARTRRIMDSQAASHETLVDNTLKRNRLSVRAMMIATGASGAFLGLYLRDPGSTLLGSFFLAAFWWLGRHTFFKHPLSIRLILEVSTLILLVYASAIVWTPQFYSWKAKRCDELARQAAAPGYFKPEQRIALDREAAWFSRRASELRWKGWWMGLTLGPVTRQSKLEDLGYEFGTLESIEKHEKRVKKLLWSR
jgi:hypothetical protein